MKVREIMSREPRTCRPDTTLEVAGHLMAEVGCGIVPVVGESGHVVGVITDRDVCLTLTERDRRPSETRVLEAMRGNVVTCRPEDDARDALGRMTSARVRRLPVVDREHRLVGMLSIDDVAIASRAFTALGFDGPCDVDIGRALRSISRTQRKPATG